MANKKNYYSLSDRYNYYKEQYETGKVVDKNGDVHKLGMVSRLDAGIKASNLLNRIDRQSRQNYMANKYPNRNAKQDFPKKGTRTSSSKKNN